MDGRLSGMMRKKRAAQAMLVSFRVRARDRLCSDKAGGKRLMRLWSARPTESRYRIGRVTRCIERLERSDEQVDNGRGKKLAAEVVLAWLVNVSGAEERFGARCQWVTRVGFSWQRLELEIPESQTPQKHYHHTRIDERRRTRGRKRGRKAMCSSEYE